MMPGDQSAQILQSHGYGQEITLQPGEVLLGQGTASDGVYYVKSGRLAAYREEPDATYLLSEVEAGEIVGELGAITGRPRSATVRAEELSEVIYVSNEAFRRALKEAPGLAAEILSATRERLTDADVARVALRRSYHQAIHRVQDLSSEKARLEELLRVREELADTIVHDLRNPLGVIHSGLELLQFDTAPAHVPIIIETMSRSLRRMQRLVDTLLDIARLESGEMLLQVAPVDLHSLITALIEEERPLSENHNVALDSHVPVDLPPAAADRDLLQRVLVNLLDNSLKFTPAGGRVWVEAGQQGAGLSVAVVDTGPGIPLEERQRIFEKFTQVEGQVGRRRGSGLGLAFCRMAVEAHGGHIWVEEGPAGVGSRFVLTLPVA